MEFYNFNCVKYKDIFEKKYEGPRIKFLSEFCTKISAFKQLVWLIV